jgi:hypothetical protein
MLRKIKNNFGTFLKVRICVLIFSIRPSDVYMCVYMYNTSVYVYVYVSEYVLTEKGTTVIKRLETPLHFPRNPQLMIT